MNPSQKKSRQNPLLPMFDLRNCPSRKQHQSHDGLGLLALAPNAKEREHDGALSVLGQDMPLTMVQFIANIDVQGVEGPASANVRTAMVRERARS